MVVSIFLVCLIIRHFIKVSLQIVNLSFHSLFISQPLILVCSKKWQKVSFHFFRNRWRNNEKYFFLLRTWNRFTLNYFLHNSLFRLKTCSMAYWYADKTLARFFRSSTRELIIQRPLPNNAELLTHWFTNILQ